MFTLFLIAEKLYSWDETYFEILVKKKRRISSNEGEKIRHNIAVCNSASSNLCRLHYCIADCVVVLGNTLIYYSYTIPSTHDTGIRACILCLQVYLLICIFTGIPADISLLVYLLIYLYRYTC